MKTNKARKRIRRVTVAIGPETQALMEELLKFVNEHSGRPPEGLNELAGSALNYALDKWGAKYLGRPTWPGVFHDE
jgi:hypothetical protein